MDESGSEPDYRFTLANERTFLAWVRTSLALLAGAVGVVQLVPDADYPGLRRAIGVILGVSGLAVAAMAYRRWASREHAMRHGEPLPRGPSVLLLGLALTVVAGLVLVLVAIADA